MSDPNSSQQSIDLDTYWDRAGQLCLQAFDDRSRWPNPPEVTSIEDVNQGRGAFSVVLRVGLAWPSTDRGAVADADIPHGHPASVVVKLPVAGPNGQAARVSGAYRREALAYRELLVDHRHNANQTAPATLATPKIYLVDEPGDETCSLVMEDLSDHRSVDQLDGLGPEDALRVAEGLAHFHHLWASSERLEGLDVRRNTIAVLAPEALSAGLGALRSTWADVVSEQQRSVYERLVEAQPRLVEAFAAESATLCHGDPRADNLVFTPTPSPAGVPGSSDSDDSSVSTNGSGGSGRSDSSDRVVLFDWQQMAVQFGEADLSWLSATSIEVDVRRQTDRDLVHAYGGSFDRYRLGLALPGMTVLLLAQREATSERTRRFIATSLQRIAAAIDDLDVADLV